MKRITSSNSVRCDNLAACAAHVSMLEPFVIRQCRIRFDGWRGPIYTARRMFVSTRNSRIGLALFAVYLVFYGAFVLLAAFSPQTMEATPLAGVNLAIWYGFGLIAGALVLALLYGWTCRQGAQSIDSADADDGSRP
jgi:uncharacterized membrane protein (DUF485 family)